MSLHQSIDIDTEAWRWNFETLEQVAEGVEELGDYRLAIWAPLQPLAAQAVHKIGGAIGRAGRMSSDELESSIAYLTYAWALAHPEAAMTLGFFHGEPLPLRGRQALTGVNAERRL